MAYEVIKRVSGRAYRYRVESYRDPVTRRVRGKWTYLGRVEGEGTLSPERKTRPSSRDRLLDAVEALLERRDLADLSTGMVASEAGLAYGTFYRHFRDLAHVVREAMTRERPGFERLGGRFAEPLGDAAAERAKMAAWAGGAVATALGRAGLFRAWLITSTNDAEVAAERRRRIAADVSEVGDYLQRLGAAGLAVVTVPDFSAYAIVALVGAAAREAALEGAFAERKLAGIVAVVHELAGLS